MKSSPKSGEVTPLMSLHLPAALNASASSGEVQAADKMSSEPRHIWGQNQSEARGKCLSFIVFALVLPYRI